MRLHAFAPLVLLLSLATAPARAQVSDADRATARALAFEAQAALAKKDYAAAATGFAKADALVHAPTLLLGLARAQVGLGQLVAAHEAYARIVREGVPPRSPPAFARAVEDAGNELGALEPRMPYLVIEVKGAPNPQVTLDGAPLASAALGVRRMVDPGTREIGASAEGFERREVKVEVKEGETKAVALVLPPAPRAIEAPPSPPPPKPASPARRIAGWATLGLGGAGLVIGAVTGGLALGKEASLLKECPGGRCQDTGSLRDAVGGYNGLRGAAAASLAVGGAAAITGTVLMLTAPKAPVRPVVGLGFAGVEGGF